MRKWLCTVLFSFVVMIGASHELLADEPAPQEAESGGIDATPPALGEQGVEPRGLRLLPGAQLPGQASRPLTPRDFNRLPLRATGVFDAHFNLNANGPSPINTYLASYLSNIIWPEYLWQVLARPPRYEDYVKDSHLSPLFFYTEFKNNTAHLFSSPAIYTWIYAAQGGYDPEAMVISTSKLVLVVFRGTDSAMASQDPFGRDFAEWIATDYNFLHTDPDLPVLRGSKVHAGFWKSLRAGPAKVIRNGQQDSCQYQSLALEQGTFRECLVGEIKAAGGQQKKVFIMGQSLGAAHAQVFAAFLAGHVDHNGRPDGLRPQATYAVGAPHVGNNAFRDKLHMLLGRERLQRFDFVDDPTTSMPAYGVGPLEYARAGTRTYYNDMQTVQVNVPERLPIVGSTIPGVLLDNYCFHFPQWYVLAAWSAVPKSARPLLPVPLPQPRVGGPVYGKWCHNPLVIARGERSPAGRAADAAAAAAQGFQEAAAAVGAAVEQVVYNAGQLFENLLANPVADGTYTIRLLQGGKFLDISGCRGENGCKVQLWDFGQSGADNRFKIKKEFGAYTIRNGSGDNIDFLEVDADDLLDDGGRIQMWEANLPFGGHGANQLWHFYAVPNRRGLFVVRNVATGKVMDAINKCVNQNGCAVKQRKGSDNDPTQVWILERAN